MDVRGFRFLFGASRPGEVNPGGINATSGSRTIETNSGIFVV
jgi:hypothetical protein